jgi:hypothetical protein
MHKLPATLLFLGIRWVCAELLSLGLVEAADWWVGYMRDAGRSRDSDGRPPECSSSPRVLIDIADTRSFPPLSNSCHALPEHADWISFSPQLCNLPSLLSRQTGTKSLAQSREVFVYLYTQPASRTARRLTLDVPSCPRICVVVGFRHKSG